MAEFHGNGRRAVKQESAVEVEYADTLMDGEGNTQDVGLNKIEAEARAKEDFNFLAAIAMPEDFLYMWPMLYLACFSMLQDIMTRPRDFSKLAIGFPRGFAKSTFMKIVVLWAILFTKKKFILVLCATEQLAENFVSDVSDMLDHPNIKAIFGDWKILIEKDKNGYKKFYFRGRNIILAGMGAGQSLRGIVVKNARPDMMIFDDVQTKEQSLSNAESEALENWFWGTAIKAKSPHGCSYFFLANMYPTKNSLLRKLCRNSSWIKFVTGAILADGTSIWEKLQPLKQLLDEYQADKEAGKPEIFLAEVMNDEDIQSNSQLDTSKVKFNPYEGIMPLPIPYGKAIVIDPATDKKNSDLVSIGYHEYFFNDRHGRIDAVLTDLAEGRWSPGEIIKNALIMGLKHQCPLICIEGGSFQATLIYWFEQLLLKLKLEGFMIREITTGGRSKNARVFSFFKSLHSGEALLHSSVRAQILNEGQEYNPLKTDNVDGGLDVAAYGLDVASKYRAEITAFSLLQLAKPEMQSEEMEVVEDNSFF